MTDETPFLEAIADRPYDDAPRLVFADWLDERGDTEWAEFIRVQCELAQMPQDNPRRPVLLGRERQLLAILTPRWLGGRLQARQVRFARGFLDEVYALPDEYLEAVPVLRRFAPTHKISLDFRPVPFVGPDPTQAYHRWRAWAAAVRDLARQWRIFTWDSAHDSCGTLFDACKAEGVSLPRVEGVSLDFANLWPSNWETFRQLGTPRLCWARFDRGIRGEYDSSDNLFRLILRDGDLLDRLESLDFGNNRLGDAALSELKSAPVLGMLDLSGNLLTDRGAATLLQADLPNLFDLDLSYNAISDEMVEKLRDKFEDVHFTRD